MKKLILLTALFIASCQSEDVQPNEPITPPQANCNCGIITEITFLSGPGYAYHQFKARNNCTNNNSVISIPLGATSYYVGDYVCLENQW